MTKQCKIGIDLAEKIDIAEQYPKVSAYQIVFGTGADPKLISLVRESVLPSLS